MATHAATLRVVAMPQPGMRTMLNRSLTLITAGMAFANLAFMNPAFAQAPRPVAPQPAPAGPALDPAQAAAKLMNIY